MIRGSQSLLATGRRHKSIIAEQLLSQSRNTKSRIQTKTLFSTRTSSNAITEQHHNSFKSPNICPSFLGTTAANNTANDSTTSTPTGATIASTMMTMMMFVLVTNSSSPTVHLERESEKEKAGGEESTHSEEDEELFFTNMIDEDEEHEFLHPYRYDHNYDYNHNKNENEYYYDEKDEARNFEQTLNHHRSLLQEYKSKWDWQKNNSPAARIPTISWPLDVPDEKEVKMLFMDFEFCQKNKDKKQNQTKKNSDETHHDNYDEDNSHYCQKIQFRIASYLLLQSHDYQAQAKGIQMIKDLVKTHHNPDAMCAYATLLNDGRILQTIPKQNDPMTTTPIEPQYQEPNPTMAVSWWKIASSPQHHHHTQSTYELAVALYTGEGIVENESMAVHLFHKAANDGHAGAAYMLGDCLLDGVGVVGRDRGEALEWLVTAAELGHRGARSRVLAVLEKESGRDYGEFTDASRQTLRDDAKADNHDNIVERDDGNSDGVERQTLSIKNEQVVGGGEKRAIMEKQYSKKPVLLERRYTIGGGARNPVILARRKTIVEESRGQKE